MKTKEKKLLTRITKKLTRSEPSELTYFILPTTVTAEGESYVTYGIGVLKDNLMIDCVPDISDDYNKIKSLVQMCNDDELDIEHLDDIAEDATID